MAGTRRERSDGPAEPVLEVLTGSEALERAERRICGEAVAREPGATEGLALSGVRAASLLDRLPGPAPSDLRVPASCVHHVEGVAGSAPGAFELSAASLQDAIDHCLAAHRISRRLGRIGGCSLSRILARELGVARMPAPDVVADVLEDGVAPEQDAGPTRTVEIAREALQAVGTRTGRPLDVLMLEGEARGGTVLVGSGEDAILAREVCGALQASGVVAAALSVHLVRPFPEEAVERALSGASAVFVLEGADTGPLLSGVRSAMHGKIEVTRLSARSRADVLAEIEKQEPSARSEEEAAPSTTPALGRRLIVAPAGPWGEDTAREVASVLAYVGPMQVAPRTRHHLGAAVLAWRSDEFPAESSDVLLASCPERVQPDGPLTLVRSGGTVVILSTADSADEVARRLPVDARAFAIERELRLHWVAPPASEALDSALEEERAVALVLAGAALAALCRDGAADPSDAVARKLESAGLPEAASWLREGARSVRVLEPAALDPARHVEEIDFRPAATLPRLPEPVEDTSAQAEWRDRVRRFHRTGRGALGAEPHLPIRPAALACVESDARERPAVPFALLLADDAKRPVVASSLCDVLDEAVERVEKSGRAMRTLIDNLGRLRVQATALLRRREAPADLRTVVSEAGVRLAAALRFPDAERQVLLGQVEELSLALPSDGVLLDLRRDTPVQLCREVLEAVRGPSRRRFLDELDQLRERLGDLLTLDRMGSEAAREPESLARGLGAGGAQHVDPDALSRTVHRTRGSAPMEPARRKRIEGALAAIDEWRAQPAPPSVLFLRAPEVRLPVPESEQLEHPDPLAAAVGVFDGLIGRMVRILRAARVARLEVAGQYRPEVHDDLLSRLDWEGLTAQELRIAPAVVAMTSGARLRRRDQSSLSELLRSSRPVCVVVLDDVAPDDEANDLSRFHLDLGYLVMAHREALAVGSPLAHPDRLTEGLNRAARALRPSVVLVHLPGADSEGPRESLARAALEGRACPEFCYDPDAGESWADRFDLGGNPQPERPWPVYGLEILDDGESRSLEIAFTFADAVAGEPTYLRHLRIIPRVAWDEGQAPISECLEGFDPEDPKGPVPYIWVLDEAGRLQRAVVTRELAMACRDRLRAWRVLQELAGHANRFAELAASAAREQALAEADAQRAELERDRAEEIERVRHDAARESMERLATVLLSPDGIAAPIPIPAVPGAPGPSVEPASGEVLASEASSPEPVAAPEPVPVVEEEISFDEPYIDTPLCTTCNECTNLNSRLFQYNADKQAFIADAQAGTFAELVKAAELCPARCIHPGKPRSGDSTGTPDMVERAAPFN